jgi:hypothetical protein
MPGKLLAGEYPGAREPGEARKKLRRFLDAGVRYFIDLTEVGELEPYAELLTKEAGSIETTYERIPIRDTTVPNEPQTMAKIIAAIDRTLARDGIGYLVALASALPVQETSDNWLLAPTLRRLQAVE